MKPRANWLINKPEPKKWFYGTLSNKAQTGKLEMQMQEKFAEGEKPNILLDDTTVDFLKDPNCLFNLDLENFPR